jgi:hypothetical protein
VVQVQTRGRPTRSVRQPYVIPHWVRGLALGVGAAALLRILGKDADGFPRAAVLLALFLLVLAAAADVIWQVWTCRKPAAVAALSGSGEMVPCYTERLRLWVTGGAVVLAAATTSLHGGDAMSVLRAWGQLHRWAPPDLALRVTPSAVSAHQPFHLTVLVDHSVASRYRCEWQGPVGEWAGESTCDIQRSAPLHFVQPDWPTRRISVAAKVFDGDRLLGVTPDQTITIGYAPMVELIADKTHIIQGQKAEFSVRVDGHAPGPDDRCRWTVRGEFASSDRCTFSYLGKELASSPSATVQIAVEVENTSNRSAGTANATLTVDQPQRYIIYLVDASRRMAQQTPTGLLLDNVKNDLVEGLSTTDPGREYLGVATFGQDGSRPACYQNVQVPYPVQPLDLTQVKSVLYLLQPGAPDAPLASALLRSLSLLHPYARQVAERASFAVVSVAAGLDTCAGRRPEDGIKALEAVMDGVRQMTARLQGRLLTLTIGVGTSDQDRRQWTTLAKFVPTESPYVIIPAPDVVTLGQALRAAVQLGSRDYDARQAACGDLARILRTRGFDAGGAQVERYCRTLSLP